MDQKQLETKLCKAAALGDVTRVADLLRVCNVNCQTSRKSRTPLLCCCAASVTGCLVSDSSHVTCARLLLEAAAATDAKDADGRTALHLATSSGNIELMMLLLYCGVDVNSVDFKGLTPLMLAARVDNKEAASLLLQRGAKAELLDVNGDSAVAMAVAAGHVRVARHLVKRHPDTWNRRNKSGVTPNEMATESGMKIMVAWAKEFNSGRDEKDVRRLCELAANGSSQQLKVELNRLGGHVAKVASTRFLNRTPLHCAAAASVTSVDIGGDEQDNCVREILELLPELDVKVVDNEGATPLHLAAESGNIKVVRRILSIRGGRETVWEVDSWGLRPLETARHAGHSEVVEVLEQAEKGAEGEAEAKAKAEAEAKAIPQAVTMVELKARPTEQFQQLTNQLSKSVAESEATAEAVALSEFFSLREQKTIRTE